MSMQRASEAAAEPTHQTTNRITGQRRWWALAAILITMFFASLDQTVVSTALPVIVGDLKGFSVYAWVFTAYLMTSAITVPIYGKLSDVYGRKPFYIFGLIVFIVGSAVSGQAQSMTQLILARGVQGIGAGAMLSMPRATIGDIFSPRERGRWMGVISAVFGVASILGPTLGGWVTDGLGWRWIFYMNLPVAVIALVAVAYALPKVRVDRKISIDWSGAALLTIGLIPLLVAFTWAGNKYAWGSPTILGMFAFAILAIAIFGWNEVRVKEPILTPELFRNSVFTTTSIIALLVTMGMFGSLMFLPIFVQGVLGKSASTSGEILTPMMLSFIIGSVIGGVIMTRTGRYKLQAFIGALITIAGGYLFTTVGTGTTWPIVVRDMVVLGLGIGSLLPLLNVAVQNAFPYEVMGVVNAVQQFVRSLGGVIVAPILGTVLANTFVSHLQSSLSPQVQSALATLPPAQQQTLSDPQGLISAQSQAAIQSVFNGFGSQGDALYHQFLDSVRGSLAAGMHELFMISLIFTGLTVVAVIFLKEIPLQTDEFFEVEAAAVAEQSAVDALDTVAPEPESVWRRPLTEAPNDAPSE